MPTFWYRCPRCSQEHNYRPGAGGTTRRCVGCGFRLVLPTRQPRTGHRGWALTGALLTLIGLFACSGAPVSVTERAPRESKATTPADSPDESQAARRSQVEAEAAKAREAERQKAAREEQAQAEEDRRARAERHQAEVGRSRNPGRQWDRGQDETHPRREAGRGCRDRLAASPDDRL
jgi:hypothetical protein